STDKIDSEIPAPASGTLQQILVQEGQTVEINTVVGIIGDGSVVKETSPTSATSVTAAPRATTPEPTATPPPAVSGEEEESAAPGHVSPIVRRLAREHGIDLTELAGKGAGMNGRITKNDLLAFIEQRSTAPASADVERVPMSAMRKSIS